ncbi:MAG: single-stranded DNA-binding protein [Scytonema sp. PMC 1069.18]|nr:single-stranded DNA-binding protein [Scytonema sp. PMC 1069.18]MEC4885869.1 single-stranded DNA-binding protein [Scytonema sp. PMC 1070.18]
MNSCILMAEIIQEPQLRYTADNLEITEMLVQFPALREGEPPATLKVVGWGNMAKDIQQNYHQGDRILLEGRLSMNTVDRPEGFKEKRAELTVQKIQSLGMVTDFNATSPSVTQASTPVASSPKYESPLPTPTPSSNTIGELPQEDYEEQPIPQRTNYDRNPYPAPSKEENDPDDIPF